MDNEKNTYCFDKCAMLPYHLGLELRGWGYYLLYPPEYATMCTHSFHIPHTSLFSPAVLYLLPHNHRIFREKNAIVVGMVT